VFQALIAGCACGGKLPDDSRSALAWLEGLPDAPEIVAPISRRARSYINYVPNNALDAVNGDLHRIAEIRAEKRIHPYLFDANVPFLYIWRFEPDKEVGHPAEKIREMADHIYQFGRGVDMAWAWGEVLDEAQLESRLADHPGAFYRPTSGSNGTLLNCPMPGSLRSLETRFAAHAQRFKVMVVNDKPHVAFVKPPVARFRAVAYNSPSLRLLFDLRETTADASFSPWSQHRVAALVTRLRDAACNKLKRALPQSDALIERVLVCRDATEADKALRVRIVPLPSIGHDHIEPSIRRVVIEVPPDCPISADDIAWTFSGLPVVEGTIDASGEILGEIRLVRTNDEAMLAHYGIDTDMARRLWRTVTPAVLPQHGGRLRIEPAGRREDTKGARERLAEELRAAKATLEALRHAGVQTAVASVRVQREPFSAKGVRAETFSTGTRFGKERLWHLEIGFAAPIQGPLIIGDGRYMGLGLMAPVRRVEGAWGFAIRDGLTKTSSPELLARALRRAVMARVQERLGLRKSMPIFFTGHELDGAPARSGSHAHVAYVADVHRQRLLVISPHMLERRLPTREEREHEQTLEAALEALTELFAGDPGRLSLTLFVIDAQEDPLFAPSMVWESHTDYRPTRHIKRLSAAQAIAMDARLELRRRNLQDPGKIEVLTVHEGPRGGLAGRLRLVFKTAVRGPILIGRTSHLSGGLFAAIE
jgi:CRISPR-associated protein Csb2